MGQNKAFIQYNGKMLIEHAITLLTSFCSETVINTNTPQLYSSFQLPIVSDTISNIGPIGGLHATLSSSNEADHLVIPVDMPHISNELIQQLILQHQPNQITVPFHNGKREPLCAIYPKSALATIETMIAQNNYKLHNLFEQFPTKSINVSELLLKTPQLFHNLNRPSDL